MQRFPTNCLGRVVAIDTTGVMHEPHTSVPFLLDLTNRGNVPSATFDNLPFEPVKEFRFQLRRCAWVEFL
jgi:hypothetical protein